MQMNDECAGRRVSKRGGTVFLEASGMRRPRGSCTPGRGRDQDGGETGRGREGRMAGRIGLGYTYARLPSRALENEGPGHPNRVLYRNHGPSRAIASSPRSHPDMLTPIYRHSPHFAALRHLHPSLLDLPHTQRSPYERGNISHFVERAAIHALLCRNPGCTTSASATIGSPPNTPARVRTPSYRH